MTDIVSPQNDVPSDDASTRVLAVVGPTASGKTTLAEELAVRMHGEIVSADSMQLYRGMDIGTAKPPAAARRVPYWGLDLIDPGEAFSAALFQRYARDAIVDITARQMLPVLAGGTGLYLRAALDRMEFPRGEQLANADRDRYETYAAKHGPEALYALLVEVDPESAESIHRNNTRRVIRALEMIDGGVSYAEQRQGFDKRVSLYDARFVGLEVRRDVLYERIDHRVDEMMAAGLLGEVQSLMDAGFRDAITASQAIGYKEFVAVIEGRSDLENAVVAVKRASRRYAKRQLTWFRADPRIAWIDVTELTTSQAADAAMGTLDWSTR